MGLQQTMKRLTPDMLRLIDQGKAIPTPRFSDAHGEYTITAGLVTVDDMVFTCHENGTMSFMGTREGLREQARIRRETTRRTHPGIVPRETVLHIESTKHLPPGEYTAKVYAVDTEGNYLIRIMGNK